jgi:hypothetical protein
MKKFVVRYAMAGLAAYVLFLVLAIPAARVYPLLKDRLSPMALYDVHGTVWHGGAASAVIAGQRVDGLSWDMHVLPLLLGRMEIAVAFYNDVGPGRLTAGRSMTGRFYFSDIDARLSAGTLTALLNIPGVKVGGDFNITLSKLVLDRQYFSEAQGTLEWRDATLVTPWQLNFGALQALVDTTDEGIQLTLTDRGGPLQANGVFTARPDGHYQLTGAFVSRDPRQPDLDRVLKFLGNPGPDGRIMVTQTGVMPPVRTQ